MISQGCAQESKNQKIRCRTQSGNAGVQFTQHPLISFKRDKSIGNFVVRDPGGGGDSHMKGTRMFVGKLELKPKRRPIWAWLKLYLIPKGDHAETDNHVGAMVIKLRLRCLHRMLYSIIRF